MGNRKYILDKETAGRKLQRLALEVAERLEGDDADLILMGVSGRGMVIAQKINTLLALYRKLPIELIEVSLNKDYPTDIVMSKVVDLDNKNILVVDDVANSGKTLMYVLKPLLNHHPKRVQTLVVVERMHKMFPVKPDYVGLSLATTAYDFIEVEIENGEVTGAFLAERAD